MFKKNLFLTRVSKRVGGASSVHKHPPLSLPASSSIQDPAAASYTDIEVKDIKSEAHTSQSGVSR